jgi:hypothetical protein
MRRRSRVSRNPLDLFEAAGVDAESQTELRDPEDPFSFGDDSHIRERNPEDLGGGTLGVPAASLKGGSEKGPKKKQVSHTQRARQYWERQGYVFALCETRDVFSDGRITVAGRKHDLLGLWDAIAIGPQTPGVVGIQICSTDDDLAHIRKMCSDTLDKRSGKTNLENLRAWLAAGNPAFVLKFERRAKVGSQEWFPVLIAVDEKVIAGVIARRRGPRKK